MVPNGPVGTGLSWSKNNMRKTVMVSLVLGVAGWLGVMACGSLPSEAACAAGKDCVCDGNNCNIACGGDSKGSCNFKCRGGATCTFTCEGGGCSTQATDNSAITVDCSGGGCATDATAAASARVDCVGNGCGLTCGAGTTSCTINQCTSNCALTCGGASSCSNSCEPTAACTRN